MWPSGFLEKVDPKCGSLTVCSPKNGLGELWKLKERRQRWKQKLSYFKWLYPLKYWSKYAHNRYYSRRLFRWTTNRLLLETRAERRREEEGLDEVFAGFEQNFENLLVFLWQFANFQDAKEFGCSLADLRGLMEARGAEAIVRVSFYLDNFLKLIKWMSWNLERLSWNL